MFLLPEGLRNCLLKVFFLPRSFYRTVNLYYSQMLAPNHQPKVDLIDSIRELDQGLREMKFNNPDFRNSQYMRLKVLTSLQEKGLLTDDLKWSKV